MPRLLIAFLLTLVLAGCGGIGTTPRLHAYEPTSTATTGSGAALLAAFRVYDPPIEVSRAHSAVAPAGSATEEGDGLVNLASEERTTHILYGDATGGGHLYPGLPGKTSFPNDWSAAQVMHQISDVATDPESSVVGQQGARTVLEGTRGGVNIRVVTNGSDIITGYPTNLPRNP